MEYDQLSYQEKMLANGWVTTEAGQHVWIGEDGGVHPGGPPSGGGKSGGGTDKTASDVVGGMKSQSTKSGVRLDHDYEGGKDHLLKHGGELVSEKTGVSGNRMETYRVRAKDKDVLATWGHAPLIDRGGKKMPPQWRIVING